MTLPPFLSRLPALLLLALVAAPALPAPAQAEICGASVALSDAAVLDLAEGQCWRGRDEAIAVVGQAWGRPGDAPDSLAGLIHRREAPPEQADMPVALVHVVDAATGDLSASLASMLAPEETFGLRAGRITLRGIRSVTPVAGGSLAIVDMRDGAVESAFARGSFARGTSGIIIDVVVRDSVPEDFADQARAFVGALRAPAALPVPRPQPEPLTGEAGEGQGTGLDDGVEIFGVQHWFDFSFDDADTQFQFLAGAAILAVLFWNWFIARLKRGKTAASAPPTRPDRRPSRPPPAVPEAYRRETVGAIPPIRPRIRTLRMGAGDGQAGGDQAAGQGEAPGQTGSPGVKATGLRPVSAAPVVERAGEGSGGMRLLAVALAAAIAAAAVYAHFSG